MSKVVIFLANGCEEVEALTPIDVLRRGGVEAIGVSISGDLVVKGAHGINFMADDVFDNIDFNDVSMVVLPGGLGGRDNLMAHSGVSSVCKDFNEKGKFVTSICASPSVLGENGILKGKKAICYPGFENQLKGAFVTNENVVVDTNVITSKGPATALEFSLKLLEVIKNKEVSDNVAKGMLFM
ncbi:MAG: DJ-1 family glyoxalase III [Lachnospirales bacterium]